MNDQCTAQFASQDDVTYICELQDDHTGEHRSTVTWADQEEA